MKKFLTVLLVIAVMFTFSFGSAFAAAPVEGETATLTRTEQIAKAQKEMIAALEKIAKEAKEDLAAEYVENQIDGNCVISGDVYAATIDAYVADYTKVINEAAKMVKGDATITDEYAAAIGDQEIVLYEYNGSDVTLTADGIVTDADALVDFVTKPGSTAEKLHYTLMSWANALDSMKAYVNGELAKIDMSLYTNDVIDKTAAYPQTHAERAAELKADLEEIVKDTVVDTTASATVVINALKAMYAVLGETYLAVEDSYTDIYDNEYVTSYSLVDAEGLLKTAEELGEDKTAAEVDKASLKAELASKLAAAKKDALDDYKDGTYTKAQYEARLEALDAWEEVNALLIEEDAFVDWVLSDDAADRIALYEEAVKAAENAKIQVYKDGSKVFDAAKVDEILAETKVDIYAGAITRIEDVNFGDAIIGEDPFTWNKEVALAQAQKNLADALEAEDYYAPEVAKIEEAYAKVIAKIEAAANQDQLDECATDVAESFDVDCKTDVKNYLARQPKTADFVTAVNGYIALYNMQNGVADKDYADEFIDDVDADDVVGFLAEQGARKNNDVAALISQAEAFAQTVKNNGTKTAEEEAALTAANAAIKALPTVITLADKAAVEEAYELADEAGIADNTKLGAAIAAVKAAEEKAIDKAIKALPEKITSADKEAVKAIEAAIEAYEDTEMYNAEDLNSYDVDDEAAAVRDADLAAVHAAIDAIDVTDAASVEAARAAVDAYVAEYTAYIPEYNAIKFIDNMDKLLVAEAAIAEDFDDVDAQAYVQDLKVVARSVKTEKGNVKVTINADVEKLIENGYTVEYRIYRSTKARANYGTPKKVSAENVYTNTAGVKGTQYFYKAKLVVSNAEGEVVATTPLTQCKYATRVWTK